MYENYTVLFVDDDVNILSSMRRGMMNEGFKCIFAGGGREALEIIEKEKISAVVSDMRMPEMNGLDFLRLVEEKSPMTVKMVLSGYTQIPQILATVNQLEIFKFIGKPWELDELIEMIKKAIDKYIIREQNEQRKLVLETQNKAYQNILKKTSAVVAEAKKINEIVTMCGKAIIDFGNSYTCEQRKKYTSIHECKSRVFEILSKAAESEKKIIPAKNLAETAAAAILSVYENASVDYEIVISKEISVCPDMLEAGIAAVGTIFSDEIERTGLIANIENSDAFKIVIMCPNAEKGYEGSDADILNAKIEFSRQILGVILPICGISVKTTIINSSLLIGFSVENENSVSV